MSRIAQAPVTVLADPEALSIAIANWILSLAIAKDGIFTICLSGGSTPKRLYEQLATPAFRNALPWSRIYIFWGDERFVPSNDVSSNYRMVRDALLRRVPIPDGNIHPIPTYESSPLAAAAAYEHALKTFYGATYLNPTRPMFDVTLLGLGIDGHTASIFPGSSSLTERTRWVVPTIGPKSDARITLTYPLLESSEHLAFLIEGKDKRSIFRRFRNGDGDIPATHVSPRGELHIFADQLVVGDPKI